jgi:hypothetical protein
MTREFFLYCLLYAVFLIGDSGAPDYTDFDCGCDIDAGFVD